jgi:hypothetical protein
LATAPNPPTAFSENGVAVSLFRRHRPKPFEERRRFGRLWCR